jgi:hypothetical protein
MSDNEEKGDGKGKEEEGEEGGDLEKNLAAKKKFEVKKWAAVALWVGCLVCLMLCSFLTLTVRSIGLGHCRRQLCHLQV